MILHPEVSLAFLTHRIILTGSHSPSWSEDDFRRVQENLIGHLVTQKRLKLPPTLFIATLEEELEVISVCNLSGEVCKETLGTRKRTHLASNLAEFLNQLKPLL